MADTSWEYIIPGSGIYNDTSQDAEIIVPGVGIVNEGVTAAAGGLSIPSPLGRPFSGPLGGI